MSLGGHAFGPDTELVADCDRPLPDRDCCQVTLAEMATGYGKPADGLMTVRPLAGDIDRNGLVSTSDATIIKARFGNMPTDADAELDFDVSGQISTGDFSQVKPKFGNAVAECP